MARGYGATGTEEEEASRGDAPSPPAGAAGAGTGVAAGWVSTGGGSLALSPAPAAGAAGGQGHSSGRGGRSGGSGDGGGSGGPPAAVGEETPLVGSAGGGSSSGGGGRGGIGADRDAEEAYYEDDDEAYEYEEDVMGEWDDLDVHPVMEEEASGRKAQRAAYIIGTGSCVVILVVVLVIVSGVTSLIGQHRDPVFTIESDFPDGGIIPLRYGCHSPTQPPISLPLRWSHVPRGTQSLVVLMHDPDSIRVNGTDPIHWLLLNVSVAGTPSGISLPALSGSTVADSQPAGGAVDGAVGPAGADSDAELTTGYLAPGASVGGLPPGVDTRPNAAGSVGYWPPCVHNASHLFSIYVYAVDAPPVLANYLDARNVMNRFGGVPLAKLFGWYGTPEGGTAGSTAALPPSVAAHGDDPAGDAAAAVAPPTGAAGRRIAAAVAPSAATGGGVVWRPGGTCSSFAGRSCRRRPVVL